MAGQDTKFYWECKLVSSSIKQKLLGKIKGGIHSIVDDDDDNETGI